MKHLTRALAALTITAAIVVGIAGPALAVPQFAAASADQSNPIFVWDGVPLPLVIGVITGAIIPALVGLISRIVDKVSSSKLSPLAKGVILSGLSVLSGAVTSIVPALNDGTPVNLGILFVTTASAFVLSVTAYFGLLSRTSKSGQSLTGAISGKPVD